MSVCLLKSDPSDVVVWVRGKPARVRDGANSSKPLAGRSYVLGGVLLSHDTTVPGFHRECGKGVFASPVVEIYNEKIKHERTNSTAMVALYHYLRGSIDTEEVPLAGASEEEGWLNKRLHFW